MGDRIAPVVDIDQARQRRARAGAQIGRGQARRADPNHRPARLVMTVDWDAHGRLDRAEIIAIKKGAKQPPLTVKKVRRAGITLAHRKHPLSRAQRRLAWKIERRGSGVAWADSKAARGELAPVIPIGHKGLHRRLRLSPLAGRRSRRDLMDGAA